MEDSASFAEVLSGLMDERDISGNKLAREVPCNAAYICRLRNGKQRPSRKIARRLDEVLDAGGELAALVPPRWPTASPDRREVLTGGMLAGGLLSIADPQIRERLAWAARNPPRIDAASVAALADVLAAQRRAEDSLGSAAMLKPVTAQLAAVEDLVTEARGPVRPAVVNIAQQWAQLAAWLHMSVRDFPAARALWRQTLELAAEIGDSTMTATALTYRAEMAWLAEETGPMIGLAQAAQRYAGAATGQRAYSASLEARGHAMTGDAQKAERKLAEAADLASRPARQRPWLYWCTPQLFECRRGVALGYLAHDGRYRAQAIEVLTAGYASLSADMRGSEWVADVLLHRAAVHVRAGDVAEGCADALQVVPIWRRTNSVSLGGILTQLHTALQARYPADARVVELADALRTPR